MPADTSLMTTPDGRQLEYRITGSPEGPAVLFHTGTPGATADFSGVTGAASRLGLRLIGYSRPGYGRSTERPGRSVADVVEDTTALLDTYDTTLALVPHGLPTALPYRVGWHLLYHDDVADLFARHAESGRADGNAQRGWLQFP